MKRQVWKRSLEVSVVVVVYNIPREAARTLYSLSNEHQQHVASEDYEVIVVDNGSTPRFDPKILAGLRGNFRLIRLDPASPSPAQAINRGIAEARGEIVGVMIDGARIVTPGLLHFALHGTRLYARALVATLGWYLGGDLQRRSMTVGHDREREARLLDSIGWPQDGYRLFEIGTLDESSTDGWVQPISESNALFMHRMLWEELGGFDERFDMPGGGLVNLDTLSRALELPDIKPVILLGEATFHQFHGGIATNATTEQMDRNLQLWFQQYQAIRGRPWGAPKSKTNPTILGTLPRPVLTRLARAVMYPPPHMESPLGRDSDRELWSTGAITRPADPLIHQLIELMHREFRAGRNESAAGLAHFLRQRAPDEPEPQRVLSLTAAFLPWGGAPERWRLDYHLAMAQAYCLLGEHGPAVSHYSDALILDSDGVKAHIALLKSQAPESADMDLLQRLHHTLMSDK